MMNRKLLSVVALLFLLLVTLVQAGPVLIGGTSDGTIYDINPQTGAASNPRDTGLDSLIGIASTGNGTLFATGRVVGVGFGNSLYTLDPVTGAATLRGMPDTIPLARSLAFDPITRDLFTFVDFTGGGIGSPPALARIDTDTGVVTFVSEMPFPSALEFDENGSLFLVTPTSVIAPSGEHLLTQTVGQVVGLAPNLRGNFYLTDEGLDGNSTLYGLHSDSGTLFSIGATGVPAGITSLTVIPEPGTLALLGLGVVTAFRRRKSLLH